MPIRDVLVYHLEMLSHVRRDIPAPRPGLTVVQAHKPTVSFYRYLYHAIGKQYQWLTRGRLSDADLAAAIQAPGNELHVLYVDGTPAGMAELDRRDPSDVELVQFGLLPEFVGQGLGKYFLQRTIDAAWIGPARRFWLHTCELDHPVALPNYVKAGFVVFKEETIQREAT